MLDSHSQQHSSEGASWGLDSLTADGSDGRSEPGTAESQAQAVTYDHLMPERPHSRSFGLAYSNHGSSSTRASSFDSSMPYSPREYPSSATSSVMSQDTSPHSIDVSPQNHLPSFSTYLNQPMLLSAPVTTGVLWNPALQAPAPPYQPPPF